MNRIGLVAKAIDARPAASASGPVLRVDLAAIRANYLEVARRYTGATLSAVVKANAYGLGLDRIVSTLAGAGCGSFWVNDLEEALRVRPNAPGARIYTLMGMRDDHISDFEAAGVIPALATLAEVEHCARHGRAHGRRIEVAIQVDTGLGRLGLDEDELRFLAGNEGMLERLDIGMWVSHLASYNIPEDPANIEQRQRLLDWLAPLPPAPLSLSASSGVYMGKDWHFDVARVGSALFGVQTSVAFQYGLRRCYELSAPVIRISDFPTGRRLGYRGITQLERPSRIATLAIGYANGLPQSFPQVGSVRFAGVAVPFVGGIAMNMTMVDVTDLPEDAMLRDMRAVFLGEEQPVEPVAEGLGCAPNMLLTQIGAGTRTIYVDG